ncbi:hypothetical protein FKP32DRAFT_32002 [Trametes sanguinea]|nr:hypothetical protein FKP32DRAFT_32002 [Trametes sanguinea]
MKPPVRGQQLLEGYLQVHSDPLFLHCLPSVEMPSTPDRIVHRGHKAGPPFSAGRESDVAVRPIKYCDILQAVRTADKALAKESATQYVVSADKGLLSGLRVWLVRFIRFAGYTYRRRGFVIEDGVGVVV